jgi:bacillithiol system protein YtxJ
VRNLNMTVEKMKSGIINEWKILNEETQLKDIERESFNNPVVIFKNSYRCGISQSMLGNFQEEMKDEILSGITFYLLDIVKHRSISSAIVSAFNVNHESPQLLVIENGMCSYYKNHWNISYTGLMKHIKK